MKRLIAVRWHAALFVAIQGFACQSAKPTGAARPQPLLQLFAQSAGSGVVLAEDLCRTKPGVIRLQELDSDGQMIREFTRVIQPTARFNATISVEEAGCETEFRGIDNHDNITMPAHLDQDQNAISVFQPALIVAYAELPFGEKKTGEAAMRVVSARNTSHTREHGKAVRTIEYTADQLIQTPRGEFVAKRIEIHFEADLQMANADEHTTLFVVPGTGVVAEQSTTKVKVLGAFGSTKKRTVVLVGYGETDS